MALLGAVLSLEGARLIEGLHDAAWIGAALALISAATAYATLGALRPSPGTA